MVIDRPEATGDASLATAAQRRTAGPRVSCIARNDGPFPWAVRGRKSWARRCGKDSRGDSRPSARSIHLERPFGAVVERSRSGDIWQPSRPVIRHQCFTGDVAVVQDIAATVIIRTKAYRGMLPLREFAWAHVLSPTKPTQTLKGETPVPHKSRRPTSTCANFFEDENVHTHWIICSRRRMKRCRLQRGSHRSGWGRTHQQSGRK